MPPADPAATPSPDLNAPPQPPASAAPSQNALEATGFKWGEEAPESLRGKGARETGDYVRQLERTLATLAAAPPMQQQPAYQPAYQQPTSQPQAVRFDPYADDFSDRVAAYTRENTQAAIAQVAPAFLGPLAAIARNSSRGNPEYADVYSRYGAEVDALMAPLDPSLKAQPEAWDRAAAMVRGNHFRDFVRSEAERLAGAGAPASERAQASVPNASTMPAEDDLAAFWQEDGEYVRALKERGTVLNHLYDAARRMGYSPNEYAKTLRGAIVPRPHVRGEPKVNA